MFLLARTLIYASLFIGLLLVYVPGSVLSWSGVVRPVSFGVPQIAGLLLAASGAALALWCIATFILVGKGTPAPFDPPRRLVTIGPYRWVRNPMYIGAALALCGAALFYMSVYLLAYVAIFALVSHLFVVGYEEPVLRRMFGREYETWCARVRRWLPGPVDERRRGT